MLEKGREKARGRVAAGGRWSRGSGEILSNLSELRVESGDESPAVQGGAGPARTHSLVSFVTRPDLFQSWT